MSDTGEDSKANIKPEGASDPNVLSIKVKDQLGGEVVFKVKKSTKFEKILNAFCQKKAVAISEVRFVFDGTRINPSMTPEDMEMEDGDTVRR
ncbi:Small ubiquitin-related modifier 1 [Auxenochlorella protothecoides]|uniref:Small ubiquitin-related modifier 1 n=1 Tax=Auxenochlorella protothecoides TaxID=3075 RepID=A0A087SE78_AUXPR|nr:Small ubiquitin-related modifier 1 [Auxenochlorella protothecoides]KFM24032.1 Small ubiquitin-related modifier 1 [Auxenochlorella protothecoides]RMZ53787.1 hypothetical protein APUTEX25_003926 [Auxenochlorella protothecoides]|eukprot:RMZ53787.1 hypothetical protein APUTEX25_003926 [Auxenochlorella protothecoides]